MPFDEFAHWCEGLERHLDPRARLSHWMGHKADDWQVNAFTTRATEVAMRVGRQSGKTSVLAARAIEELHVPDSLTICIAPSERQAKIIAREVAQQLRRTDLVITRPTMTELEMSNGARVIALPSTSDTIRGFHACCAPTVGPHPKITAALRDSTTVILPPENDSRHRVKPLCV